MNKISELIKKYWYVFLFLILLIGLVSISLIQKKEAERKIAEVMEQNQNAVLKLEKTDYDVNSILTLNLLKENLMIENLAEDTEVFYRLEEDKSLSEKDEIKLDKLGEYPIMIDFNHEYGIVAKQIVLNIVDKEAPVITGVKDFSTDYGKTVDYKKGIKVSDNYD